MISEDEEESENENRIEKVGEAFHREEEDQLDSDVNRYEEEKIEKS